MITINLIRRIPVALASVAMLAAIFASTAGASAQFEAEQYPADLAGSPSGQVLSFKAGQFACSGGAFQAGVTEPSTALTTSNVNDSTCGGSGSMKMNGCNFTLEPGSGTEVEKGVFEGSLSIGPAECGPIIVKPGFSVCAEIGPQSGIAARYSTTGSGSKSAVILDLDGQIEYAEGLSVPGNSACSSPGAPQQGTWQGEWKITAKNQLAEDTGLSVANAPVFRAESASPTLSANAVGGQVFRTSIGNVECSEANFAGTTLGGTEAEEIEAHPTYGGCTTVISGTTYKMYVEPAGCAFVLGLSGRSGSGFYGPSAIACNGPEESIKLKITTFKLNCITIPPQALGGSVSYTNEGAGTGRSIKVASKLKGLSYSLSGACGSGSGTSGEYEGAVSVKGKNAFAEAVGVWIE